MGKPLTIEQMEAALYLIANEDCFLTFSDFTVDAPRLRGKGGFTEDAYTVQFNLNDCFAFACADGEVVPWDEIVEMAQTLRSLPGKDHFVHVLDWASRKRGYEPSFEDYKKRIADYRARRGLPTREEK